MTEYPDSILRVEYRSDKPVAVLTFDAPPLNIITIPTREHLGLCSGKLRRMMQCAPSSCGVEANTSLPGEML